MKPFNQCSSRKDSMINNKQLSNRYSECELTERTQRLTSLMNIDGIGLEVGAFHSPMIKKGRYNVKYVDWGSKEEILERNKSDKNFPSDKIVETDFIVMDKNLHEVAGSGIYDYIVASHVAEHVPNIVGWLRSCYISLKPGGHLGLFLPDKRYCFDALRNETPFSEYLAAFFEDRKKPNLSAIADHIYHSIDNNPTDLWSNNFDISSAKKTHSIETIMASLETYSRYSDYVDCHCWTFTDHGFLSMARKLIDIKLIDFQVVDFQETRKNEFEFLIVFSKPV